MTTNVNPRGDDLLRALDHSLCVEETRAATPERRSGARGHPRDRRLPPNIDAHLRGMIGAIDMLGDQLDLVRRDGLAAIGPCRDLLQQLEVQAAEMWAMVGEGTP